MHFARKLPRIACSSNLFHFAQPEAYEGFYEDISLFALSVKSVKEEAARQERLNNIVMDTIFALAVQILQGKRQDGILLLLHWRFETFSC